MITRFDTIPVGAQFEFRGRRYEKLAVTLARDEERFGNHFQPTTEVLCDASAPAPTQPVRHPMNSARKHHRIWVDPK